MNLRAIRVPSFFSNWEKAIMSAKKANLKEKIYFLYKQILKLSMLKKLPHFFSLVSVLFLVQIPQSVRAADAFCVVKGVENKTLFSGDCIFEQYSGNGSFSIESPRGLIAGYSSIGVSIIEPGIAEVRGLTTNGINSRWGEAVRSSSDKACWVGSDFTICAY